jgi:hypothetical protein
VSIHAKALSPFSSREEVWFKNMVDDEIVLLTLEFGAFVYKKRKCCKNQLNYFDYIIGLFAYIDDNREKTTNKTI